MSDADLRRYDPPERFARARGPAPRFHADPAVDDLLRALVALTAEVAVLRERLDTHERLAAAGTPAAPGAVEHYEPTDDAELAARGALRAQLIERVFGALQPPAEEAGAYDAVIRRLEGA